METPLRKECVVNATLMAKLVRPAEGIPPGVISTVKLNTHIHISTSHRHEAEISLLIHANTHSFINLYLYSPRNKYTHREC